MIQAPTLSLENTERQLTEENMKKYSFEEWMKKVDATVERVMGCSVYDLPDFLFRDAYDNGCSYGNVASKVMKAAYGG